MGVVESGPDEIVHRGVDDGEVLRVAALEILHPREQQAGVAYQVAARLENQPLRAIVQARQQGFDVGARRRRCFVAVADAQTATHVDVLERDAVPRQGIHQAEDPVERVHERGDVGDLRPDVAVDAGDADAGEGCGLAIQSRRILEGDAELVLAQAGGNVGVRAGIDIRIDAQAHRRGAAERSRHRRQPPQFARRFDVEAQDAGGQRLAHLGLGLAHPGEDHFARIAPGRDHPLQLAARHDVEAAAETREQIEDREIRVRLHGIANEVRTIAQCVLEGQKGRGQCRARIHIARRAEARGDLGQRYLFDTHHAAGLDEGVHCFRSGGFDAAGSSLGSTNGPLLPQAQSSSAAITATAKNRAIFIAT